MPFLARLLATAAALALIVASCSSEQRDVADPDPSATGPGTPSLSPGTPTGAGSSSPSAGPSAGPSGSVSTSPSPTGATEVPVSRAACGDPAGAVKSFRTFIDPSLRARTSATEFAADIRAVLCHERSWIAAGTVRWRYRPGEGVLVRLLPPDAAEQRCLELIGLSVARRYSCAGIDEVVINSDRWYTGAPYDWGSVGRYRRMLINHEIGHILRQRHQVCEQHGALAPVMMQQSKTLTTNEKTCRANAWPLPEELARLRSA